METILQNFHFLRPEWFLALIPAILLFVLLKTREARGSRWEDAIDPNLLPFLLDKSNARATRSPFSLLLAAWLVAVVALAGPVWEKTPRPVHEREDALVVILDLTRSMYATDVKPDRLTRARRKLLDLLDQRVEGVTGLVVFAGDAHAVVPLTDDADTIAAMIPALAPEIMPGGGSRLTPALQLAERLFHDAGVTSGHILIITDEIRDRATALETARENRYAFPVSVMSVGTPGGAPVPLDARNPGAAYLKDSSGVLVIPGVDIGELRSFARAAGGRFSRMTLTDEDLEYLLADEPLPFAGEFRAVERDFDVWIEEGPWLVLVLLPLAALAFRRGWLWSVVLLFGIHSEPADALSWEDLWKTRNQQAMESLKKGEPDEAAKLFESRAWKGSAHYRAEDYSQAAEQFADIESSDGRYNYGNALARQGQYQQAIEAYDEALALNPDNEDAAFNKRLIEELLKNRRQQQQQGQGGQGRDGKQRQQERQGNRANKSDEGQQNRRQARQEQERQNAEKEEQQNAKNRQRQEAEQQQEGRKQRQLAGKEGDPLEDEERQALEQWLRRVPDDPGGLLRRKFLRQYEEKRRRGEIAGNDRKDW